MLYDVFFAPAPSFLSSLPLLCAPGYLPISFSLPHLPVRNFPFGCCFFLRWRIHWDHEGSLSEDETSTQGLSQMNCREMEPGLKLCCSHSCSVFGFLVMGLNKVPTWSHLHQGFSRFGTEDYRDDEHVSHHSRPSSFGPGLRQCRGTNGTTEFF